MTEEVIVETKKLTKKYKHNTALNNINLKLEKGKVYGFIGKNGAGKTTFIRIITGLAFLTSGELSLFGNSREKELQEARRKIGALVEGPSLYPFMSAKENLKAQQIQLGKEDEREIGELLDLVGLSGVGNKKARNFSLGMKQRLGIAMSLIGNPDFLIWDEPINGLDPEGIKEIRILIDDLNKKGKTLLISSHILGELENTATDFIIIDKGNIIENISKDELLNKRREYIDIVTSDNSGAISILKNKFPNVSIYIEGDHLLIENFSENIDYLSTLLSENQINIREMRRERESLEDYVFAKIRS
ncbi:ABC transporter ATP-binding protein [Anaerococcus octavius]|uniref:Bacitracin ABC transporter ATP-binding protein n=1 Tax=Anaerococcus octavius TaxID=54007 RepID=A0A2I1M8F8_9FIRM|nr:ATP-binding cassette domain-containing protein [Anaerococcus octavius]PKZ16399.1 bacitracin ABC transporter ATP-binding protein [Anaerococcus octavius]